MVLLGSMGVGKTTIGGALASRLGSSFTDVDELIMHEAGEPVASLFERLGEADFRRLERDIAVRALKAAPDRSVVSLGGGTFTDYDVRLECRQRAKTIYLRAQPDVVLARLTSEEIASRPLLASNPSAALSARHRARDPLYLSSDVVVNAEAALDEVLERVLPHA
ncbi:MAG: shikimate kinase [Bradymonadia bacterium]|jgi:shikimate kinase